MKRLLAVVVVFVIPPAIYFPTIGAQRQERLEQARERLSEIDMRIAATNSVHREVTTDRVPPTPAIDEIHELAESLASENDIRLTRFEPNTPKHDNALEEQSITAEVIGGAEATAAFLRRIQTASKIIDVSGVTLTKDPAGWRTDFVITTYAMR